MSAGRVLVTGGAGFLGSCFVRQALATGTEAVLNFDLLTYAGDPRRLAEASLDPRYSFRQGDVASPADIGQAIRDFSPGLVVHYAAESHVTRSESDPGRFFLTNVEGTRAVMEAALAEGVPRVIHVSTDEVYGSISTGLFKEGDKLAGEGSATSAYARSKALADDVALSYSDRLEVVVARPTNAFGPFQLPEKAFPRWITRALRGEPVPVWGDGLYVRQWLSAGDFASAIMALAEHGAAGEAYNVAPRHEPEITNLELARWLVGYLGLGKEMVVMTEYDRPDHDRRYGVDPSKIEALGWHAGEVWPQLAETVDWYRASPDWWEPHLAEAESIYQDTR